MGKNPKTLNDFKDQLSLNAGQMYCRMFQESIQQYFRPSLSYHLSLRPLFLSTFDWPFYTGFTVYARSEGSSEHSLLRYTISTKISYAGPC